MALRVFPTRVAVPLIILLTLIAGVAEGAHHRQSWDPSPITAPAVIAIMGTVIHDTLAQGLSSMHLLLNAADQEWTSAPGKARDHVRQAAGIARDNLAEARRFVRDLTPSALDDSSLPAALSRVCDSADAQSRLAARFRVDGRTAAVRAAVDRRLIRL